MPRLRGCRFILILGWLFFASSHEALPAGAIVQPSRTTIGFAYVSQHVASPVQPVFVANAGDAPLTVFAVTLEGPQAGDFWLPASGTCVASTTLRPGDRCRIDVVMTPSTARGHPVAATLVVHTDAQLGIAEIALTGIVDPFLTGPIFTAVPSYLDFATQSLGTTSQSQSLVITNASGLLFSIAQFALIGGDGADFALTSNCATGQDLPYRSTCTATVTFKPGAVGQRATELATNMTFNGVEGFFHYSITGVGSAGPPVAVNLDQHGLTGSWYEPATSGQGVELEVFPDLIATGTGLLQGSWFTYDHLASGGADHGRWYTFGGNVASNAASATLPMYRNIGGNFNAPPVTSATQVGSVVLSFSDCATGRMDYTFTDGSNRSGSVPLTRLTPNVTCTPAGGGATDADFGYSGNWYDPAKAGQGFVFEVNPTVRIVFFAWYTYAVNGQSSGVAGQRWYTGQASYVPGARSMALLLYETTGGLFDAQTPAPHSEQVGTATVTFGSCAAAQLGFAFTSGSNAGQSGSINLVRVGPVPAGCGP